MNGTPSAPSPEHLALLSNTIRDVARTHRLPADEAEDFAQSVQVRFLERDYDVFDRFEGRSSLRTYLVVVVSRMLLDWRNSHYGKWRPSRVAVRLGEHAVRLERLISRDGHQTDEAITVLRMQKNAPSACVLRDLVERLPPRRRRRRVSDEALRHAAVPVFEDPIEVEDRRRAEHTTRSMLAAALRELSSEDRWLIQARYVHDRSVQAVAQALNTDPQNLYRRYERVLRTLRRTLASQGVAARMLSTDYCLARPARGPSLQRIGA